VDLFVTFQLTDQLHHPYDNFYLRSEQVKLSLDGKAQQILREQTTKKTLRFIETNTILGKEKKKQAKYRRCNLRSHQGFSI